MDLKEAIATNKNKTWFIFTPPPKDSQFSELVSLADWYNNQVLMKAFQNKKLNLKFGEKTLLASSHLLPTERLAVFGLGSSDSKTSEILKIAEETMTQLNTDDVCFLVSKDAPKELAATLQKKYSQVLVG